LSARVGRRGAGGDRPLAREPATAVVAAVAFAPPLAGAAQMPVQRAAGVLVGPEVAIDRLVADRELLMAPQPARHLLGAPILSEQDLDPRPRLGREPPVASGARALAARVDCGMSLFSARRSLSAIR